MTRGSIRVDEGDRIIVAVIAAYNEAKSVGEVVREAGPHTSRVYVIDDGSEDETSKLAAQAGAIVLRHPFNIGAGAAIATGLHVALEDGAEIVVTLDADGQHDPSEISEVVQPILSGEADLVIGTRFLSLKSKMPLYKWLGNKIIAFVVSRIGSTKVSDTECNLRAYCRDVALRVVPESRGYAFASEMLLRALKSGFKVKEVPVHVTVRNGPRGTSILDGIKILLRSMGMVH